LAIRHFLPCCLLLPIHHVISSVYTIHTHHLPSSSCPPFHCFSYPTLIGSCPPSSIPHSLSHAACTTTHRLLPSDFSHIRCVQFLSLFHFVPSCFA
jgi:hypothetical protein